MTALTEADLLNRIDIELTSILAKFTAGETPIGALLATENAVLDTLILDVGAAVGASLTADLAALNTEADTMLTASA